jgi:hypothetical protein
MQKADMLAYIQIYECAHILRNYSRIPASSKKDTGTEVRASNLCVE